MIIVTGGAGFIGSNLVAALNADGETDILIVDRLGENFRNLGDRCFSDFMQPEEFVATLERAGLRAAIEVIFHQGACADTTQSDGDYMMENNFTFSKRVLHFAVEKKIPLVYASSASVYGSGRSSQPVPDHERPLNLYALSKLAFDHHVRALLGQVRSTVVGLRYFNVYGPRERHKGRMASMVYQLYRQLKENGRARLFEGTDGFADGEQQRDFVFVRDVVSVNRFFARKEVVSKGILNVGTGAARSFNDVARALIKAIGKGEIEYFPFPESLKGKYQSFTQADVSGLRAAGFKPQFASVEAGIAEAVGHWEAESLSLP
jgi:ADP-L-glycero-D-manno-heptose 6-epimerase